MHDYYEIVFKYFIKVRPQEIIRPTSVVKTEYSTFTYFVTSLNPAGQTITSTDIIVSSNVVTETINVEPTPGLPGNLVCFILSSS